MAVQARQSVFVVSVLSWILAITTNAHAIENDKPLANDYWRGGYFGAAFSLSKLKNTYSPITPFGSQKLKANGKLIGLIGGYNVLQEKIMWGIEADLAGKTAFRDNLSFVSTLRARIGKPINYSLPFITAGFAAARVKNSSPGASFRSPKAQFGFVVGAGFEQVIANAISGRLEYTYGRFLSNGTRFGPRTQLKDVHMLRASVIIHLRD